MTDQFVMMLGILSTKIQEQDAEIVKLQGKLNCTAISQTKHTNRATQ